MSDFKAKMHQIVCRLGLRPRPHWGSLERYPDLLGGFYGPTSKEGMVPLLSRYTSSHTFYIKAWNRRLDGVMCELDLIIIIIIII